MHLTTEILIQMVQRTIQFLRKRRKKNLQGRRQHSRGEKRHRAQFTVKTGEIVGWDTREALALTRRAGEYPCKAEPESLDVFFGDHLHSKLHGIPSIFKARRAAWNKTKTFKEFFPMKEIYAAWTESQCCKLCQRLAQPQTLPIILIK